MNWMMSAMDYEGGCGVFRLLIRASWDLFGRCENIMFDGDLYAAGCTYRGILLSHWEAVSYLSESDSESSKDVSVNSEFSYRNICLSDGRTQIRHVRKSTFFLGPNALVTKTVVGNTHRKSDRCRFFVFPLFRSNVVGSAKCRHPARPVCLRKKRFHARLLRRGFFASEYPWTSSVRLTPAGVSPMVSSGNGTEFNFKRWRDGYREIKATATSAGSENGRLSRKTL